MYGQRRREIILPIVINLTAGFGVRTEGIAIALKKFVEWVFRIDVSGSGIGVRSNRGARARTRLHVGPRAGVREAQRLG